MFTNNYNKSLIQQELERQDIMENFKDGLNKLMDKYTLEDAVLYLDSSKILKEATTGYFVEDTEYSTLKEALSNSKSPVIRIKNNEIFVTGVVYEQLTKCPRDKKILDLDTLQYVSE